MILVLTAVESGVGGKEEPPRFLSSMWKHTKEIYLLRALSTSFLHEVSRQDD